MKSSDHTLFRPQDQIGDHHEYQVLHQVEGHPYLFSVRGPKGECDLYAHPLPQLRALSTSGQDRERRAISRELSRWRKVLAARPTWFDHFWEKDTLCWVEPRIAGAPLSSLQSPLSLYEGISLIEECLCALDLIHAERDLQMGDPLLHLNLSPENIWRSREGALIFFAPLSPTLVERCANDTMSDDEALSGERAPELLRGRYGMSSDLYAIGMSALSAMTGMSLSRVDERLQSERLFVHDLPCAPQISDFLSQLTAFRASARFQSAREALIALQALPIIEPVEPLLSQRRTAINEGLDSVSSEDVSPPKMLTVEPNFDSTDDLGGLQINPLDKGAEKSQSDSPLTEPDHFYTLAKESKLGTFASERLGLSSVDPMIVDALIEEDGSTLKGKRELALMSLFFITFLFYVISRDDTKSQSPTLAEVSIQKSASNREGSKQTDEPSNGLKSDDINETLKETVTLELKSSPHPEWIKLAGGPIIIGSSEQEGYESERPQRVVQVTPFSISRTEVTVLQYAQCVAQGMCTTEGLKSSDWGDDRLCNWDRVGRADHPLNCVSWEQAQVYAQWVGGRLPSEVEWSFAAQGGTVQRQLYPWGEGGPSCEYAVLADFTRGAGCGAETTLPVCQRPLGHSKQGVCDLVGNVWEWVMDDWHPNYEGAPLNSQPWVFAEELDWIERDRVYRGGGAFDEQDLPRIARRGGRSPKARLFNLGFRVARD